jgi:FlaA1/EpsC-like NDP-sugar epimerase
VSSSHIVSFTRNRYVLAADVVGFVCAAVGAFTLRFDWLFATYRHEFPQFLVAALLIKPVVFFLFGMYRRVWRYTSVSDALGILLASSASSITLAVVMFLTIVGHYNGGVARSVLFIDWLLTVALAGGIRLSIRLLGENKARALALQRANGHRTRRVLIVGAGDAGVLVAREMQRNPQLGMIPVGFLDDEPDKRGKHLLGLRVLGGTTDVETAVRRHDVDEAVIAMPTASGQTLRAIVEGCREARVPSRTIPGVYELIGGTVTVSRLRDVDIADLLQRAPATTNPEAPMYLHGATVLVTGGGGSIGSELCRQIARARPATLVLLGHGENSIFEARQALAEAFTDLSVVPIIADVRDRARLERVLRQWRPSVVFHAAAHKHVPLMERNPEEALSNNVLGTHNLVEAAIASNVERLVLISTDKAVSPVSLMGASKRLAETIVRAAAERTGRAFMVVRFGNVLGSRGSVVPAFKRQIARGGPITITHPDMTRFFMTIPEAVHLVLEAGGMGTGGEVFALNMGEPVRIVDMAKDLVRLSGLRPEDIPIVYTGMRPGERLDEQLWETGAMVDATSHPEILHIVEPSDAPALSRETIETLSSAVASGDRMEIEAVLATLIPTFVPGAAPAVVASAGIESDL